MGNCKCCSDCKYEFTECDSTDGTPVPIVWFYRECLHSDDIINKEMNSILEKMIESNDTEPIPEIEGCKYWVDIRPRQEKIQKFIEGLNVSEE